MGLVPILVRLLKQEDGAVKSAVTAFVTSVAFIMLVAAVAVASAGGVSLAKPAPQEARNLTVLAGAGQDTVNLLSFFPQTIRLRAGDTLTWQQNSRAAHTVSFLGGPAPGPIGDSLFSDAGIPIAPDPNLPVPGRPGVRQLNARSAAPYPEGANGSTYSGAAFISSGRMAGVPQTPGVPEIQSFSLKFDTPGTYTYVCLTHALAMSGTVVVADASATDVPSQAEIDARARQEIAGLTSLTERAALQGNNSRSEPGPQNNSVWFVSAGSSDFQINDTRAYIEDFLPKNVTITAGDTVLWGSTGFHSVTFNPTPPVPPLFLLETLPDGSQAIIQNPASYDPIKPAPIYNPSQFYNSGILSLTQPNGTAWSLTFDTPGVFEYYCSVHRDLGMVGTVTVLPRS
jgi:plastocyanin